MYGEVESLISISKESKKDGGKIRSFALVSYKKDGGISSGAQCAEIAVDVLHGHTIDDHILSVKHVNTSTERHSADNLEQEVFITSKKKCNLFVKNFPSTYNEEKFLELFEECGEIESVKIIEGQNDDG